jgi:predicted nuclease of restriction endonuclease-like RecB superfamily
MYVCLEDKKSFRFSMRLDGNISLFIIVKNYGIAAAAAAAQNYR